MNPIVHFDKKDNLATTLRFLTKGETIFADDQEIVIEEDIPQYHKVALVFIQKGEFVIKYGEVIGKATMDIRKGTLAHVHNIESLRGRGDK
ncbi:UxaA family hydrolase [Youngiibacter multivorans]|uniref:Altronate dehydratase small subunit n=1 Tax=Youngiibacter multivorans TaxID=937251 RepID=A0ABS4G2M1_9CLOT|nr:UxaA family hydrolase [Youngiibacter multivorans]MBP1918793.1 altronate dehydratase small subunit [Youngiibacter multivorans]